MVFVTWPRPPGALKKAPEHPVVLIVGDGQVPESGNALKERFWVTLSMGISKLGVFVKL